MYRQTLKLSKLENLRLYGPESKLEDIHNRNSTQILKKFKFLKKVQTNRSKNTFKNRIQNYNHDQTSIKKTILRPSNIPKILPHPNSTSRNLSLSSLRINANYPQLILTFFFANYRPESARVPPAGSNGVAKHKRRFMAASASAIATNDRLNIAP